MLKPKQSIQNMAGYFVPMYEKDWDIKIDSNENNYGPSPKVRAALNNCDTAQVSFYPFYGELSQKIADYQGVDISNIKVTNGADESISAVIQTYMEPDDALLTLDISFDMPVVYAQIQGGKIIKVPFREKWVFPVENFLKELDNPDVKVVYIASPNNPTGNIINENDLKQILANSKGKAVIIDETYANYGSVSYKKYALEYDNVFIIKSFSKDFALAGLRLGYIISCSDNIDNLKKVVSPFSVNSFAMKAGIAALDDIDYFNQIKKEIDESKTELKEFFESLGGIVYDSYANFLLVDFKQKAGFFHHKLSLNNISVKMFKKGSLLENHLRITIPTKKGAALIKKVLEIKPSLVFDMDGVLINAVSYRQTILKTYEKYSGKQVTLEEVQKIKNQGGMNNDWDLTLFLLRREGIDIAYEELVNTFQQIYWDDAKGLINIETPLFDIELFEELSKDYNLSVFTGRLKKEAYFALEKFNILKFFYPVITTDDIPNGKGKPDSCGLNLVKDLSFAKEFFYFGDTVDDMICAKNAGYYPVGTLPPQDKSEDLIQRLKNNGAKQVISSVGEIKTLLEQKYETV